MSSDLKNDELLVRLTKKEPMTPIMDIKCERDDITTNLTDLKKKYMVREYTKLDNIDGNYI